MIVISSSLIAFLAVCLLLSAVWAIHLRDRDASIIDPVWGVAIWTVGFVYALDAGLEITGARLVALLLTGAWALRLGMHLHIRHGIVGEDRRYRAMREKRGEDWWWQSFFVVFLLQAVLAWIVALPLIAILTGPSAAGAVAWAGFAVAALGFAYESVADGQLAHYKHLRARAPSVAPGEIRSGDSQEAQGTGSREKGAEKDAEKGGAQVRIDGHGGPAAADDPGVMDGGLWRYSRHPNYFGEMVFWWGIGGAAAGQGLYWGLLGSAVITFMLLKVSGVSMTEADIADRKPAYRDYVRRTNAVLPGRPSAGL